MSSAVGTVLDIGCADKSLSKDLPEGCTYIGIDLLDTAKNYYSTRPDLYADATQLPLNDSCIDTVALLEVLEHVPTPADVLQEIRRVLRPNGILFLTIPFIYPIHDAPYDFHRFTQFALDRYLKISGFETISLNTRLNSFEVAGLLTSLALADSARLIVSRYKWALPLLLMIGLSVLLNNLLSWLLARLLPTGDFMPGGYELIAIKKS